jgi:VanZ family protein
LLSWFVQIIIELAQKLVRDTTSAMIPSRFWKAIAWAGYVAIVIVSLVPGSVRPHIPGFPGELEHFLAYGVAGSAYGLAYCSILARVVSGLILTGGAALLEGLQSFVPNRTPELADIFASSVGAWIGLGFAVLAAIVISRPARR